MEIGVVGSGSFGTAIATLLSHNNDVLVYARNRDAVNKLNTEHKIRDVEVPHNVRGTNDMKEIGERCRLIFPMIPSEFFRSAMGKLSKFIGPGHILIHGTKGLDVSSAFQDSRSLKEVKRSVFTMTEVIRQETSVVRTGALAGPNLAKEILAGQPAATVIASEFHEVVEAGRAALASKKFIVFGSENMKGIELAGALKNVVAIASGVIHGMGFGSNMAALTITRGLREMILVAKAVGAEARPFLGTAGIGDLIATATSTMSRNYTFGRLLSEGMTVDQIKGHMYEVAEGYRTLKFAQRIIETAELDAPMIQTLYNVVYNGRPLQKAMIELIQNPLSVDVDFL